MISCVNLQMTFGNCATTATPWLILNVSLLSCYWCSCCMTRTTSSWVQRQVGSVCQEFNPWRAAILNMSPSTMFHVQKCGILSLLLRWWWICLHLHQRRHSFIRTVIWTSHTACKAQTSTIFILTIFILTAETTPFSPDNECPMNVRLLAPYFCT